MSKEFKKGNKTYINNVAQVLRGEKGNYIKFDKDITLPKGAKLFMKSVDDELAGLVSRGIITEAQAEERRNKIPDFVISYVTAVIEG